MKKIVVTATFRSFTGGKNDGLQLSFLRSLAKQTYQNFVLVVTVFREKNVESTVREILGEKAVFVYTKISEEYRYSPTKVVLNGITYGIKNNCDILLDCSGDIILQDNLLETVAANFTPMYSGISHPHIFYDVDDALHIVGKHIGSYGGGIDVRFFDMQLLNCVGVKKRLENYALYDWGGIEHLLFGISQQYADKMINIFEESKIVKVKNDREAVNENIEYLRISGERNRETLKKLSNSIGMDFDDLMDLLYIHMQYKLTKNRIRHFVFFRKEWKVWFERRMKKRKGFFNKILLTIVHWIM